jgi:hypothetical protein
MIGPVHKENAPSHACSRCHYARLPATVPRRCAPKLTGERSARPRYRESSTQQYRNQDDPCKHSWFRLGLGRHDSSQRLDRQGCTSFLGFSLHKTEYQLKRFIAVAFEFFRVGR